MSELKNIYSSRKTEVLSYLDLLATIDKATKSGRVVIAGIEDTKNSHISMQQIKMLHSTLFLHLYNLIEWTLSSFVQEIVTFLKSGRTLPYKLPPEIFNLWIANVFHADKDLSYNKKIEYASYIYRIALNKETIGQDFTLYETIFKKNVDLSEIKNVLNRFGIQLQLSNECHKAINQNVLDDKNILSTIKSQRNKLAHGETSFFEASEAFDFQTLYKWANTTLTFTDELVEILDKYLDNLPAIKITRESAKSI